MTAITASSANAPHAAVAARRPWLVCSATHRGCCGGARPSAPAGSCKPAISQARSVRRETLRQARSSKSENFRQDTIPHPPPGTRSADVPVPAALLPGRSLRGHGIPAPSPHCENPGRNAWHRETALPPAGPAGAPPRIPVSTLYNACHRALVPVVARCNRTPRRKPDRFQPPSVAATRPSRRASNAKIWDAMPYTVRQRFLPPRRRGQPPRVPASTLYNDRDRALVPVVAQCDRTPRHKPERFRHPIFAATCRTRRACTAIIHDAMPHTVRPRCLSPNRRGQPRRVPASTLYNVARCDWRRDTSRTASGTGPSPRRAALAGRAR
jgi:hypothetical protein